MTLRECARLNLIAPNDSVMDLWVGRNSDEKLVIRPEKWTNIARFINGVGNRGGRNLDSLRVCYRGLPVVMLVARRDIERGESLSYDYNAGGISAKYDTSGFVD
ncbi:MAG: hypothetical protein KDD45_00415 [Bdellovibrionales bacterium]|nr:hypothetical protein [Bdellovibrionales bacterium]